MNQRWRVVAFLALLLLATGVLVLAFAWPGRGVPWRPERVHDLPPDRFESPVSRLTRVASGLRVEGRNQDGWGLALQQVPALDGRDYRYLCFDLDRIPPLARPVALWKYEGRVTLIPLPDAPFADGCVDLLRIAEWSVEPKILGIGIVPVDYVAPNLVPEGDFELRAMRLESSSWKGALSEMWMRWSAYRPWEFRANSTAGFELYQRPALTTLQAFAAAWLALALAMAAAVLGARSARKMALPVLACVAILLTAYHLNQLRMRAAVAGMAAAAAQEHPAQRLAVEPAFAAASDAFRARLASDSLDPRLLFHAGRRYLQEYPAWLLRTHDVGILPDANHLPSQAALRDYMLVMTDTGSWSFDPANGELRVGDQARRAAPYFAQGPLRVFRFDTVPSP